jgi:selenocysteine lyase/cysteine desulfurase
LENAFDESRFDSLRTKSGAGSFMVGMPNYTAIYAINAALSYIESIGVSAINEHANTLGKIAREGIAQLPVELLGPVQPARTSGIISFKHPDFERINASLHKNNIHLMAHAGRMRVAIHGYNNLSDIDQMLAALKEAIPA